MIVKKLHFCLLGFVFLLNLNTACGGTCSEKFNSLIPHNDKSFTDLYTELQKLNPQGSTKLALQSDFDDLIDPTGGGACASTTAFNILQGLRLKSGKTELIPKPVLTEAFASIPELLAGRVTNAQMTKLLNHFNRYLPEQSIEVSFERAPQSKAAGGEEIGKVWKVFEEKQLETQPNEVKMLVYQVHDSDGELLGRHFVVLKKKLEGKKAVVIDPSKPAKDFSYEFVEEPGSKGLPAATTLLRPDRVPHSLGWEFTLDTIFSVKLTPNNN